MNACRIDIGKPPSREGYNDNDGWLCCAVVVPESREYVSHNDVSYWCSLDCYGIDLRIGKQSHYGIKLTKAIKDGAAPGQIKHILLAAAIAFMKPVQFVDILDQVKRDAKREARNALRESLADLLSLE